jgi:TRAP-type C4-dicarboxylate transport system substrate-binding protein
MDDQDRKGLASAERRNFLKIASTAGFTAALVAGAAGTLWSTEAAAQSATEERDREAAAEHVMTIATAYVLGASRSYPIMQLDLKENIQNATNGKVYVKLAPGGQLGAGGALGIRRFRVAPFKRLSTRCQISRLSRLPLT